MLHTVGGSDVMRDLSWNCDVGLAVDFDKFHLSSLMSVESFLLDEKNNLALYML